MTRELVASREPVIFDVGETLIDESRVWRGWAAYLKVPEADVIGARDDLIARGEPLRHVACGTALEARWWCPTCEQTVDDPDAEDEVIHV